MQERGRSGTPTLGFRSRSCVCSPWMRCGIDPDKLSVGQSNDDQDGSKPMVGTTNRIHGVAAAVSAWTPWYCPSETPVAGPGAYFRGD
jgi:hypothetical protein